MVGEAFISISTILDYLIGHSLMQMMAMITHLALDDTLNYETPVHNERTLTFCLTCTTALQ